jgi:hypothetical protein
MTGIGIGMAFETRSLTGVAGTTSQNSAGPAATRSRTSAMSSSLSSD